MKKISLKVKIMALAICFIIAVAPICYAYSIAEAAVDKGYVVNTPVKSKDYSGIIGEAQRTKEEYEKKAAEARKLVENLSAEYDALSAYIAQLDIKSDKLYAEVAELEEKKLELEAKKDETVEKLAEAEARRDEQYATMSARIKYAYENGETSYLDILLNVASLSDLLNRVEYVSAISKYDDELFSNYSKVAQEVADYNEILDNQLAAIDQMTETYNEYCDYADKLAAEKDKALEECAKKLGTNKEVLSSYLTQIENASMTIAEAEKKQKEEAAAAEAAAQANKDNDKPVPGLSGTGAQKPNNIQLSDKSGVTSLIWPVPGWSGISSYFGPRKSPTAGASSYHKGIDIWCSYGTRIVAASAGTVVSATYSWDCGNYVMIQHADGNYTIYMHNSSLAVSAGQYVKQGQVIAYAGSTGISTGVHCHFGVMVGGSYVNPLNYVKY